MQADNSVAYPYVLCNLKYTDGDVLQVREVLNKKTLGAPHSYVHAPMLHVQCNGSLYNCYVAQTLEDARAAAADMAYKYPLSQGERAVLCKIKQRSVWTSASVTAAQAVLAGATVSKGVLCVSVPGLRGPYIARDVGDARAVLISRTESGTVMSAPRVMLEPVPGDGLMADNGCCYSYVVLRCTVRPDGKLDVSTSTADAVVRAEVGSYRGDSDLSRNVTLVRDDASLQQAAEQEHARMPRAQARLLVCEIQYVSQALSASAAPTEPTLRTDSKWYRYVIHCHNVTAGALDMRDNEIGHWSALRGPGMYLAETLDEANRIVTELFAAEPRAASQMWLVSRIESVPRPTLVFVPV